MREWAIDALARHFAQDWRTVPFLIERLKSDPDARVRKRAASALGDYAPHDPRVSLALSRSWGFFAYADSLTDRQRIAFQMEHFSNEPLDEYWNPDQDLLPLLERDINEHIRFSVRCQALITLDVEFGPRPEITGTRLHADPDPRVRIAALRLFAAREGNNIRATLERSFEDVDGEVRAEAIRLLSVLSAEERPAPQWFETVATTDPTPSVRRAAVYAMATDLTEELVESLCRSASGDADARVRAASLECLAGSAHSGVIACLARCATAEEDLAARMMAWDALMAQTAETAVARSEYGGPESFHTWATLLDWVTKSKKGSPYEKSVHPVRALDQLWHRSRSFGESELLEIWDALKTACLHDPDALHRLGFIVRAVHWFRRAPELRQLLENRVHKDPDSIVREFADAVLTSWARTRAE